MAPTRDRNRTGSRAPARGADTRAKLLRAALELFGRRDFDDVTTRQLADSAGVNLAAIPYHFGSKENVYVAVAEQIVSSIQPRTYTAITQASQEAQAPRDPAALLSAFRNLVLAFTHEVIGVPDASLRAGFILREQFRPGTAFDVLYEGFMRDLHTAFASLYAALLQGDPDTPAMAYRAQCVIGQVLVFRMGREVLLRRLAVREMDAGDVANFVAEQNVAALKREIEHGKI